MLSKVLIIAWYAMIDGLRNKILRALLILAVILSATNIFIAELFTWDLGKVAIEFGLSTTAIAGLILIFFLSFKLLTDDLERHSIYLIMARPVSIQEYVLGKFLGLGALLFLALFILFVGSTVSLQYVILRYPQFVPPDFSWVTFVVANILQLLSLMIVLSVVFMWFAFTVQPFVALLLSISTYMIGQNMELLRRITLHSADSERAFHKIAITVISWIFPNLSFFNIKASASYGLPINWLELFYIITYGLSYIGIMLFIATILFKRKELT